MGTEAKVLPQEVVDAKAKGDRIFKTTLNGTDVFYVRQISRIEYKTLSKNLQSVEDQQQRIELHDEHVAQAGVVFPKVTPEYLSKSGAGFVTAIANEVLRLSGFTNDVQTEEV